MATTVRERLVEAAGNRFVADGVLQTRLEDIRREAGVSVGALYHHFADKEDLYGETWIAALENFQRGFQGTLEGKDAEQGVRDVVAYQLRWVAENRRAAKLLYGARPATAQATQRISELNHAFFESVLAWWGIHSRYGAVRAGLSPELLHALWLGPTDDYCRRWLDGDTDKAPRAAARQLADAAWDALKGDQR